MYSLSLTNSMDDIFAGNILRDGKVIGTWQLYGDSCSPAPDYEVKQEEEEAFYDFLESYGERMFVGLDFYEEQLKTF